jgi:hypothetical protein
VVAAYYLTSIKLLLLFVQNCCACAPASLECPVYLSVSSVPLRYRHDLEYCNECVWVEIHTLNSFNLLIGNHYFPPDAKPENIAQYFRILENYLDTHNFHVIMVGDFNAPGFNWKSGLSLPNSHYYSKLKGDAIYTSTCLLNLNQRIDIVGSSNLFDLIFSNLSDLRITPVDPGLIKPDYHYNTYQLKED